MCKQATVSVRPLKVLQCNCLGLLNLSELLSEKICHIEMFQIMQKKNKYFSYFSRRTYSITSMAQTWMARLP